MTKIVGDEELKRKLSRLTNLNFLRPQIQSAVDHLAGKMKIYPPATAANRPNAQGRWYQRGFGTKWIRRDGSIGGQQTSQNLKQLWVGEVQTNTRGIVGNDASYARYVQGPEQSSVMEEIGWKTTDQIAEEEGEFVLRKIQEAIERELQKG